MLLQPRAINLTLGVIYYSYYYMGLQNNFVLSLQSGETLGITVRL